MSVLSKKLSKIMTNLKDINDNKKFWARAKPLFFNKISSAENIFLDESEELIKSEVKVAYVFDK